MECTTKKVLGHNLYLPTKVFMMFFDESAMAFRTMVSIGSATIDGEEGCDDDALNHSVIIRMSGGRSKLEKVVRVA